MDYITQRTEICEHCPICDLENWLCNANLYLNPDTNDVSLNPKKGYIKGCGCALEIKIKKIDKHCPAQKW